MQENPAVFLTLQRTNYSLLIIRFKLSFIKINATKFFYHTNKIRCYLKVIVMFILHISRITICWMKCLLYCIQFKININTLKKIVVQIPQWKGLSKFVQSTNFIIPIKRVACIQFSAQYIHSDYPMHGFTVKLFQFFYDSN